jgi:hypothetical protein
LIVIVITDQFGRIEVILINQKRSLTAFLDSIQLPPATTIYVTGHLDIILDKIDTIAASLGQRHDSDSEEAWEQYRRELYKQGVSSAVLQQNEARYPASDKSPNYTNLLYFRTYDDRT